jgi:hypothetical protein
MKTISTPLTPFFKFIHSTMWFFVCGLFFTVPDLEPPILKMILVLPFFAFWEYSRIKRVAIDEDFLYVSNYFRSERIPLDNIDSVTDNIWLDSHPVTIHLKEPCSFGRKIIFMPQMLILFFQHHPIVKELQNELDARKLEKNL